ncbi:MAG TPA: sigma-70 family RNA polymerase sigma factor [Planctomycetota bacterium]|nr:sigma-70 family RNA polymerase sigma factor [Planctomycetota bacterium]
MEELLEQYEWIRRLASRLVVDETEADDLAQDAILIALQRKIPAERPPRAWLAVVMRNLRSHRWRDESARRRRERATARREPAPPPEEGIVRDDLHRVVLEALQESNEPARSVLLLRFRDGLDTPEIARRLGMPGGTVRSHLTRGLESVRESLDRRHGGDRRRWRESLLAWPDAVPTRRAASSLASSPAIAAAMVLVAIPVGLLLFALARNGGASSPVFAADGHEASRAVARDAGFVVSVASTTALPTRNAVAVEAGTAALEGEILDVETREPVPYFAFDVSDAGGARESLSADDGGRFRTSRAYAPGELVIAYEDQPGMAVGHRARIRHDHRVADGRAPSASFFVRAGPTYWLDLAPPDGLRAADFEALLRGRGTERTVHGKGGMPVVLAPVQDGAPPWVRFGIDVRSTATMGDPWTLHVISRDGFWWGSSTVDRITGHSREPVAIALHPAGVVRGRLLSSTGAPLRHGTVRPGWPIRERRAGLPFGSVRAQTSSAGEFELRGLEAGAYTLRATAPFHDAAVETVVVEPGRVVERDLVLQRSPSAGDVRGRVRSQTGRFDLAMSVEILAPNQPPGTKLTDTPVEWSGLPNERVGTFRFEGIPAGRYTVYPAPPHPLVLATRPKSLMVEPGDAEVEFELLDDDPEAAELVIEARDAASGAEIPMVDVLCFVEGHGTQLMTNYTCGTPFYGGVPPDQRMQIDVRTVGYVPASGTDASFVEDGKGRRVMRVRLDPGWGITVFVEDDAGAGVAGAAVLVDGEEAGVTDASGLLPIVRASAPRTLGARYRDWTLASTDCFDAKTGRFLDFYWPRLEVRLRPPSSK